MTSVENVGKMQQEAYNRQIQLKHVKA